jgi:hypothetical protein
MLIPTTFVLLMLLTTGLAWQVSSDKLQANNTVSAPSNHTSKASHTTSVMAATLQAAVLGSISSSNSNYTNAKYTNANYTDSNERHDVLLGSAKSELSSSESHHDDAPLSVQLQSYALNAGNQSVSLYTTSSGYVHAWSNTSTIRVSEPTDESEEAPQDTPHQGGSSSNNNQRHPSSTPSMSGLFLSTTIPLSYSLTVPSNHLPQQATAGPTLNKVHAFQGAPSHSATTITPTTATPTSTTNVSVYPALNGKASDHKEHKNFHSDTLTYPSHHCQESSPFCHTTTVTTTAHVKTESTRSRGKGMMPSVKASTIPVHVRTESSIPRGDKSKKNMSNGNKAAVYKTSMILTSKHTELHADTEDCRSCGMCTRSSKEKSSKKMSAKKMSAMKSRLLLLRHRAI